jgi:hypothetical protein
MEPSYPDDETVVYCEIPEMCGMPSDEYCEMPYEPEGKQVN